MAMPNHSVGDCFFIDWTSAVNSALVMGQATSYQDINAAPAPLIDIPSNNVEAYVEIYPLPSLNYSHSPTTTESLGWTDKSSELYVEAVLPVAYLEPAITEATLCIPEINIQHPPPAGGLSIATMGNYSSNLASLRPVEAIRPLQETAVASSTPPESVAEETVEDIFPETDINTKELALEINFELRRCRISQTSFARVVMADFHGNLGYFFREPKPWAEQSDFGKRMFLRMWRWLQIPRNERMPALRLAIFKLASKERQEGKPSPPKPRETSISSYQKRVMNEIFKITQSPSTGLKEEIAKELGLKLTTVFNFFSHTRCKFRKSNSFYE